MNVLIIKKKTNYELFGNHLNEEVSFGVFPKDEFKKIKDSHEFHYQTLFNLYKLLDKDNIAYHEVTRETFTFSYNHANQLKGLHLPGEHTSKQTPQTYDAIITVGGDGTLLSASQQTFDQTPIVGIKSSPTSIGYLCAYSASDVNELVQNLKSKTYHVTSVQRLKAEIIFIHDIGVVETPPVLNDFLFTNIHPAAISKYRLSIGSLSEDQRSSGLWISTPAGSTAAIAATGGKRQPLASMDFQYSVRERYQIDTQDPLLTQGFFNPDRDRFEVENRSELAILALDGQHGIAYLTYGDRIILRRATPLNLMVK